MPEQMRSRSGELLTLPDIVKSNKYSVSCTHEINIDGVAMEITQAVRYLLADRERILTELADVKSELAVKTTKNED